MTTATATASAPAGSNGRSHRGRPVVPRLVRKAHVPMILNGARLSNIPHERREPELDRYVREYVLPNRVDVAPPFQRDDVWGVKKQQQFIASLFNKDMAIPPFFLCLKRANAHLYYALDCRQRHTTIANFTSNKFSIVVWFEYDDGTIKRKRMTWEQIQADENCASLVEDFKSRKIQVIVFDPCPFEEQRKIFTALNNGEPLNVDELCYCNFYLARKFLDEIYDRLFCTVDVLMYPKIHNKKRFGHIRTTHELLLLVADQSFNGTPDHRPLRKQERMGSAGQIHRTLAAQGFKYEDGVTPAILKTFPNVDKALGDLRKLCDLLYTVMQKNTNLGRTDDDPDNYVAPRNVIDPVGFLYKKITEAGAKYTADTLGRKQADLVNFLTDYYANKDKLSLNQSTSDKLVMAKKYQAMEKFYAKHLA